MKKAEGKVVVEEKVIHFMRYRKPLGIVSLVLILLGLASLATRGLNLGLDFTGGTAVEVDFVKPVDQETIHTDMLKAGYKDSVVQYLGLANQILIRMPPQVGGDGSIGAAVEKAVNTDPANPGKVKQVDSVGSEVGGELYTQSLLAIALAIALMMGYVAFRYRWKFSGGAIAALIHDTFFTLGMFSVFGWPFDLTVLAAVLALIGYSLNDKVVVFDRIRENFRKLRKADVVEITDISLTETLRRTVMTVATVLLVSLALLLVGGPALHWFAITMLVGLFAVTYSSIYIATAYALWAGLSKEDFMVKTKTEVDARP